MGKFLKFPEPVVVNDDSNMIPLLERSIYLMKEQKAMKDSIEVSSRSEGEAVRKALENPVTKAIVVVEGVLAGLSDKDADRVIAFVKESRRAANE